MELYLGETGHPEENFIERQYYCSRASEKILLCIIDLSTNGFTQHPARYIFGQVSPGEQLADSANANATQSRVERHAFAEPSRPGCVGMWPDIVSVPQAVGAILPGKTSTNGYCSCHLWAIRAKTSTAQEIGGSTSPMLDAMTVRNGPLLRLS